MTDLHVLGTCRGCEGLLCLIDSSRAAGQCDSRAAQFETALDGGEAIALQGVRHERVQERVLAAERRTAVQRGRPGDHNEPQCRIDPVAGH